MPRGKGRPCTFALCPPLRCEPLTPWGPHEASRGRVAPGGRKSTDLSPGQHSALEGPPTRAPTRPGVHPGGPRLPGLDRGMTRGKWRREGLRGLWRQKHPGEVTRGWCLRAPKVERAAEGRGWPGRLAGCQRQARVSLPPSLPQGPGKARSQALHQLGARGGPLRTPEPTCEAPRGPENRGKGQGLPGQGPLGTLKDRQGSWGQVPQKQLLPGPSLSSTPQMLCSGPLVSAEGRWRWRQGVPLPLTPVGCSPHALGGVAQRALAPHRVSPRQVAATREQTKGLVQSAELRTQGPFGGVLGGPQKPSPRGPPRPPPAQHPAPLGPSTRSMPSPG